MLEQAGFPPDSHDAKALTEICESYPRDSLFQIERDELFGSRWGSSALGERQRVRVFLRRRPARALRRVHRLPARATASTPTTATKVARILMEAFDGTPLRLERAADRIDDPARPHRRPRPHGIPPELDEAELERKIVQAIRAWSDDLRDALVEEHGEQVGLAVQALRDTPSRPATAPTGCRARRSPTSRRLEELDGSAEPILRLYRPLEAAPGRCAASCSARRRCRCRACCRPSSTWVPA